MIPNTLLCDDCEIKNGKAVNKNLKNEGEELRV